MLILHMFYLYNNYAYVTTLKKLQMASYNYNKGIFVYISFFILSLKNIEVVRCSKSPCLTFLLLKLETKRIK